MIIRARNIGPTRADKPAVLRYDSSRENLRSRFAEGEFRRTDTGREAMVDRTFLSVLGSAATVALIVLATRWLVGVKGAQLPKSRNGTNVYGIKWHIRALGLAVVVLSVVFSVWSRLDQQHFDWKLAAIAVIFFLLGLWLASGSVSTTQTSITKRILWRSLSFRWDQVTEVRLHKRDGGAIELRAGARKLIVDSRFVAFEHLLNEIQTRTQLRPVKAA